MKYIQNLISEFQKRAETEMPKIGIFEPIEIIIDNSNQSQHVGKYGLKISTFETDHNSTIRFLDFVAISNTIGCKTTSSIVYEIGTRDEILLKLSNPNINEDLGKFVKECSMDFLLNSD
jgi:hypothetical protein